MAWPKRVYSKEQPMQQPTLGLVNMHIYIQNLVRRRLLEVKIDAGTTFGIKQEEISNY